MAELLRYTSQRIKVANLKDVRIDSGFTIVYIIRASAPYNTPYSYIAFFPGLLLYRALSSRSLRFFSDLSYVPVYASSISPLPHICMSLHTLNMDERAGLDRFVDHLLNVCSSHLTRKRICVNTHPDAARGTGFPVYSSYFPFGQGALCSCIHTVQAVRDLVYV